MKPWHKLGGERRFKEEVVGRFCVFCMKLRNLDEKGDPVVIKEES